MYNVHKYRKILKTIRYGYGSVRFRLCFKITQIQYCTLFIRTFYSLSAIYAAASFLSNRMYMYSTAHNQIDFFCDI